MLYFILFYTISARLPSHCVHSLVQYIVLCTSWSLQCSAYKYNNSVFRFILNLYLTFYSPVRCLAVNSRDTFTTKPHQNFLVLFFSILKKPSVIEHRWSEATTPTPPNPINNPSLPCNLRVIWFQMLPKLCLFEYILPWKRFFLQEVSCVFLPPIHI